MRVDKTDVGRAIWIKMWGWCERMVMNAGTSRAMGDMGTGGNRGTFHMHYSVTTEIKITNSIRTKKGRTERNGRNIDITGSV